MHKARIYNFSIVPQLKLYFPLFFFLSLFRFFFFSLFSWEGGRCVVISASQRPAPRCRGRKLCGKFRNVPTRQTHMIDDMALRGDPQRVLERFFRSFTLSLICSHEAVPILSGSNCFSLLVPSSFFFFSAWKAKLPPRTVNSTVPYRTQTFRFQVSGS